MKDGQIKIDKKIPLPEKRLYESFPFAQMKVGDSFAFPTERLHTVYQAASQFKRRSKTGWSYTCRKQAQGYRFWRTK